ncbi:hypothetical protein BV20DRAFT_1065228 [Pilatotrama ljubarskyi]|nr:hypothetical protein BV20DRAFT_1065228 [Pilatotrama ljubarskyi]
MLTLAPTFACRRSPTRLIPACHYTAIRQFTSSTPQTLSPASSTSDAGSFSLAGTAPYHTAYVLLHTHLPPAEYPARSRSPLWRAFTMRARQWGGVVNFVWSPEMHKHPDYRGLGEDLEAKHQDGSEKYTASVFSIAHRHGRLEIPEVSLANLDEVDHRLRKLVLSGDELDKLDRRLHLFVCTHGSRDCRCGEGGGEVARALRRELDKRGLGEKDVVLGEVAHVGGHKYAANVLVYPYGDWLGMVQDFDVPRILDEILAWHAAQKEQLQLARSTAQPDAPVEQLPPLCPHFWRGRMGLDKDEQVQLLSKAL